MFFKRFFIGWIPGLILVSLIVGCANPLEIEPAAIDSQPVRTVTSKKDITPPSVITTPTGIPSLVVSPTSYPTPRGVEWKLFVSGLIRPVDLTHAGDDSGRLFVLEQPGRVRIIQNGRLVEKPFLDIVNKVGSSGNEQGLLGIAFPPDYVRSKVFYLYYTARNGDTVISRFRESSDSQAADSASEQVLLTFKQPFANHNGGGIAFGPSGYLYIGSGDGGSAGDPQGNGQSLNTLLGKLLRIDVSGEGTYKIPPDNPFRSGGGRPEIWAYGLRNPWRFAFDGQTGDLYIADVGQNLYEEIDFLPAGSPGGVNFGWAFREGAHPYKGTPPANVQLVDPVWEYGRDQGCSVTGGYVYRGKAIPALQGVYLFGDYCNGRVWGLARKGGSWQASLLYDTDANISSFGLDAEGELYLLDLRTGTIYRLE